MRFFFKIEITPDHASLRKTKGYFCSLLISNIFFNPRFLNLPFAHSILPKLLTLSLPQRDGFMFCRFAKGEFPIALLMKVSWPINNHLYIKRITPPCLQFFLANSFFTVYFPTNKLTNLLTLNYF